jgi:hypothetical protein
MLVYGFALRTTGSNPESMYTAGSAVLVGRECICFSIRFLNSSSCASGVPKKKIFKCEEL